MIQGTSCCALDSIWGSQSTAPSKGKVATCGRAPLLCTAEQASRQCQQDSSRLAKGVARPSRVYVISARSGELTNHQCPVLMHLIRVTPPQLRRKISGWWWRRKSRRPPRLHERGFVLLKPAGSLDASLVDPAGSRAVRPRPPASMNLIFHELVGRLGTLRLITCHRDLYHPPPIHFCSSACVPTFVVPGLSVDPPSPRSLSHLLLFICTWMNLSRDLFDTATWIRWINRTYPFRTSGTL